VRPNLADGLRTKDQEGLTAYLAVARGHQPVHSFATIKLALAVTALAAAVSPGYRSAGSHRTMAVQPGPAELVGVSDRL
jgi:hypothetical protein